MDGYSIARAEQQYRADRIREDLAGRRRKARLRLRTKQQENDLRYL